MRLETLSLAGVLRFTDRISLDLRELPAGLIAITGANGEGKTTLLEAGLAALYRQFPTRPDRELFDYVSGSGAHLEATFAIDGRGVYRARVNLDGPRRTSDAVLFTVTGDASGYSFLNDGKVSTFDQAVSAHFPPLTILLASAFAAQNRSGSFITLDRKGRRQLFASLLGLDHYEAMAQTARAAGGLLDGSRGRLLTMRDTLRRDVTAEAIDALFQQRVALETQQRTQAEHRHHTRVAILAAEAGLGVVRGEALAHARAAASLEALEAQRREVVADLQQMARAAETARDAAAAERTRLEQQHKTYLADIATRIANNRTVLDDGAVIHEAVAAHADLTARLDELREEERQGAEALTVIAHDRDRAVLVLGQLQAAAADLARAVGDTEILSSVPCGGEGAYAACRFLARAHESKARIPVLQAEVAKAEIVAAHRDSLSAEVDRRREALSQIMQRIAATESERRSLDARVKLLPGLKLAEVRIHELEARFSELTVQFQEQMAGVSTREQTALAEASDTRERGLRRLDTLAAQIDCVEDELQRTADASAKAVDLETQLTLLRATEHEIVATLAGVEAGLDDVARREAAHDRRLIEIQEIVERIDVIDTELLEWQLLAKALGRDGLPTLEIDAAGPTVSAFCNDLMTACFGARFQVELVTQEAKAGGKGLKEAFELKVYDNDRSGDTRDVSDLSGGEQILVDEALKNALALYVNARHECAIRTCWRDETTGPLDPENARRYMDMLRRVQEVGGFHQTLFVTHNPDAARQADAQVCVAGGRLDVRLPPYAES